MNVNDRYDHYVGEVRNGYVYNSNDKYVGKVSSDGKVEDSGGSNVGTVYQNGKISGTTKGGNIYAEGSVNDDSDRHVGKVSGINMFSSTEDRYFAGGAALLLLLQPLADRASTPITRSSAKSKEVYLTRGGRIVWKYTVRTDAERKDADEEIASLKQCAIVYDFG